MRKRSHFMTKLGVIGGKLLQFDRYIIDNPKSET